MLIITHRRFTSQSHALQEAFHDSHVLQAESRSR
jgi:hypothetical protein